MSHARLTESFCRGIRGFSFKRPAGSPRLTLRAVALLGAIFASPFAAFSGTIDGAADTFTEIAALSPTTTTLTGPLTSSPGSSVTFYAFVPMLSGGGTVAFKDGAVVIPGCAAVPLGLGGDFQCTTSGLATGVHTITAEFSGNAGQDPSTSAPLLHGVGIPTFTLTAAKFGAGDGTVTSDLFGINCGATCSAIVLSTVPITLTAVPDGASVFTSWTGCDSTGGSACTLTSVNANRTVTARFTLIVPIAPGPPTLASATGGDGIATVRFSPPLSDGDAAISSYTAACNPGGFTASGATSPLVVSGLTNDAAHSCTVSATNSAGTGALSNLLTATPMATVAGPLAYIQNGGGDVSVVDSATNRIVATTTTGADHREILVHPFLPRAYVPRYGANAGTTVTVIDTSINTVTGSIPVGTGPDGVALSPGGDRLYVANYISGDITVVDTSNNGILASVPVAAGLGRLAVHPSGNPLYAVAGSSLAVVDTGSLAVTIVPLAGIATDVAVNPSGSRLYVAFASTALGVAVFNTASNTLLTTISFFCCGTTASVAMNGSGSRLYTFGASSAPGLGMIDTTSNTVFGYVINPGFTTCGGCVSYFDVAVNPAGTTVWMTAGVFSQVSQVDAATGAHVTTFGVGTNPMALAFAPSPADAPVIGAATAGSGSASVAFTPPASPGGSPITGYGATCSPGAFSGTAAASPITVSGLTAGTAYTCKVWAINASGPGPTSAPSNSVTPTATPTVTSPSSTSITGTTATLGGIVTSDGGSAITERGVVYSETTTNNDPLIGETGVTKVPVIGTTGLFAAGVTGLAPTTGHSFKAFATNAIGTSYTSVATFTTTCPTITLATLPNGNVNLAYTGSATASGGTGPYTYAVTSGSLPGGLSLTASSAGAGSVSGTPTTAGTFPFEITATDTSGAGTCAGVQSYNVVIDPELGQDFFSLTPCRLLDTRNAVGPLGGPALAAQADRTFVVAGICGIPADAKAISLNIAVTQPSMAGNIRLHPGGTVVPLVSAINYKAGQTRSNNAVIPLSALGELAAYLDQVAGTAHLILDVNGYFK